MPYCIAKYCHSSDRNNPHKVRFYQVPTSRANIRRQWLAKCGRPAEAVGLGVGAVVSKKYSCVCSLHFVPEDFNNLFRYRSGYCSRLYLKSDAVPSVFANADSPYNAIPKAEQPSKREMRMQVRDRKQVCVAPKYKSLDSSGRRYLATLGLVHVLYWNLLLARTGPGLRDLLKGRRRPLDVLNTITIKQEMQDPPIGNESLGDLTRCCTCGCFQTIPDMPDPTPSLDFMDTIMIKQEMQDPPIGNESPGDLTRCYTCRCSKTIPDKQDPTPSPDIMDTILIKQEKQDPAPSPDVMDAIIIKQEMQDPPIGNESPGDLPPGYSYRWSDIPDPTPSPDVMDTIIIKQEMQDPPIENESPGDLTRCCTYRCSLCVSGKSKIRVTLLILALTDGLVVPTLRWGCLATLNLGDDLVEGLLTTQNGGARCLGGMHQHETAYSGASLQRSHWYVEDFLLYYASTDVETTKSIKKDHTYATKRNQRLSRPPPKLAKLAITLCYPNQWYSEDRILDSALHNGIKIYAMDSTISEMCQPAKFNDSEELIDVPEEADDNNIFLMAGALERSADGEDMYDFVMEKNNNKVLRSAGSEKILLIMSLHYVNLDVPLHRLHQLDLTVLVLEYLSPRPWVTVRIFSVTNYANLYVA
ncbi:hypothetical protein GQR58_008216 [Nymphon striatum]|nr:hypothetical protein GQR58_008216 [Nymphon striatum]